MRRRLGLVLAVLAFVAVACHSSENFTTATGVKVHWQQNVPGSLQRTVEVVVPAQYATSSFMYAVNAAVLQANRSPYLDFVIDVPNMTPSSCPNHCILVRRANLAYPTVGVTSLGWDGGGHMYGMAVRVTIDTDPMTQATLNKVACHEIVGHGAGLKHSSDGTPGPCQNGQLTSVDLNNIAAAHNHRDRIYAGGGGAPPTRHTIIESGRSMP
jgi:hypothetical protein